MTGPPQITSKSPANITQYVETNVTLVCTVIADPNPTTSWKRADPDGKFVEIKRADDKFDGNFTIHNARLEDSGTYLCNASNTLGYDYYTTEIIIKAGKLHGIVFFLLYWSPGETSFNGRKCKRLEATATRDVIKCTSSAPVTAVATKNNLVYFYV